MTRFSGRWLLLFVATSGVILVTYARYPGCIARDRSNSRCEWTGDMSLPRDQRNPAHQQHLIEDAQLAEELAIRHATGQRNRINGGVREKSRQCRREALQIVACELSVLEHP
jgi:hypothetical protein